MNDEFRVPRKLPSVPSLLAVTALGIVVGATAPLLGHSVDSVFPRLTHGVALAILLAARGRDRTSLVLILWGVLAVAASLAGGPTTRVIAATGMVVAQSILITAIFERLSPERPLDSVSALVRLFAASIIGCLPVGLLGAIVGSTLAPTVAPDHSWLTWWLSAAASCAMFVPITMSFDRGALRRESAKGNWHRAEFVLLILLFAVVLLEVLGRVDLGLRIRHLPHAVTTLPFLVWAALRFGVMGTAIASLLLVIITMGATASGTGPYVLFGDSLSYQLRVAGYFLAVVIGSVMLFAVALVQRAAEERRTAAAYAQLRAIVESAGDLIAAVDTDLVIVATNPAWVAEWQKLSGVAVAPGMSMKHALRGLPIEAEGSISRWRRALAGERFVYRSAYGEPSRVREDYEITYSPVRGVDGEIVGAAQVVRNVTERRRREAEEGEARRLESIGRLAGGVAHDFNNLMAAVIGYSDLVAGTLAPEDPRRADLAEIERAAARAGELTQQLLAFARRRVIEPQLVDPGALVSGFCRLLAPLLGPNIVLVVRSAPDLALVRVDPTQFEQVVMNLAINARDAMGGAGRLLIETTNDERDGKRVVLLSVRDTGAGMTPEVQARMFEPFFTTKPLGEGTGLGLPTVHGIVHQALGHIDVQSAPGGTTFRVYFPAAAAAATRTAHTLNSGIPA